MRIKQPTVYTTLFILIIAAVISTWIVPAGQYDQKQNAALQESTPIAGTYHQVESQKQSIFDVFLAPVDGFYDHKTGQANAIDVALFVLIIGGFLAVVDRTGTLTSAITSLVRTLKGREIWMIPFLMTLFALGGTVYGMAEETVAFYPLIIPAMIRAGYDTVTGVAIVMVGAGIGCLASTINPFSTIIASNAAGISFLDGIGLRIALFVVCLLVSIVYVMRYARRVRSQPDKSLVYAQKDENEAYFLGSSQTTRQEAPLTSKQKGVLCLFCITFAVMIWGVSADGWWMAQMSAWFLFATIVIAVFARIGEAELVSSFFEGARSLLGVAFIIALARAVVVVLDNGHITPTLLYWAESAIHGTSTIIFINGIYVVEALMSVVVPSSSGLAALSIPIFAPLGHFADVPKSLIVTTFQTASGLPNLINPTSAVVMAGIAMGKVSYGRWLRFVAPLMIMVVLIAMICISIAVTV